METRIDDLHFVSWAQTQKIFFLWRNFRFGARSNYFPKYTEITYFVIHFVYLLLNYMKTNTKVASPITVIVPITIISKILGSE